MNTEPMKKLVDLDWATMQCPCGESICGNVPLKRWDEWVATHAHHCNGMVVEITTDNGARAWSSKPPPVSYPLVPGQV